VKLDPGSKKVVQSGTVSVIVPAYNHERYIQQALDSVAQQTAGNIELIVINDGSSDDTARLVRIFIEDHPEMIIHFIDQTNKGVCRTLNHGLSLATGEYIALLASDDYWAPERLAAGLSFLERNPEIGMVFSDCWLFCEKAGWWYRWSEYKPRLSQLFKDGLPVADLYTEMLIQPLVPALTVLVRRDVIDSVGAFDGELAYEDYDLWLRIAMSHPIGYIEQPLAHYRMHEGNVSNSGCLMFKGMVQTIQKHFRIGPYRNRVLKQLRILLLLAAHVIASRIRKRKPGKKAILDVQASNYHG